MTHNPYMAPSAAALCMHKHVAPMKKAIEEIFLMAASAGCVCVWMCLGSNEAGLGWIMWMCVGAR